MAKYVKTEQGYKKIETVNSNKMDKDNPVGTGSFSMGRKTGSVIGTDSHAEGNNTTASGNSSHAEGGYTKAIGGYSHAEGYNTKATSSDDTVISTSDTIKGYYTHAEGYGTVAYGRCSHAEGNGTKSSGNDSHAEGYKTIASSDGSHAEGLNTKAFSIGSHAEGSGTTASGTNSHAEGILTTASGDYSHAEGGSTTATGSASHAEGDSTKATGHASHAEGFYTKASSQYSHAEGKYNIEDTANKYAHIIGNGTKVSARSNAHTLDWNGNAWFAGDVYTGSTSGVNKDEGSKKLATEEYVDSKQDTLIQSGASVGQIAKITAVDDTGKPTAWEAVDMPSGGGGHWETVLDTVWEQDVINPTAYDAETGVFTCAAGELDNLELNTEYAFFQQCTKEGIAYNTIIGNEIVKVTKLSETTFSIDVTPPTTFVPTNVKFSRGAALAITDIDAKKIRLTLDGQFLPTATRYNYPFYGVGKSYFGENVGYMQVRNAYQAYQQVTAEVESPYRIVGKILCGFNAPSNVANLHFKNNSFCCPMIPYDVPEGNERKYLLTSDGTKIAKLYSSGSPWQIGSFVENVAIINDYLRIISGTKVKLERWVE